MEELKPCPFCGSKPVVCDYGLQGWGIACSNYFTCDIRPTTDKFSTKEQAAEAWNRRYKDAQTD